MLAKKKCPRTPKEKSAFAGALEPYAGGIGDVVIPKQDTFLSIADRSLSRLRGSPLPGAGCLGLSLAWVRLSCCAQLFRSLVSRGCGCFSRALLRRLCRRCAFGLAVPFGFWLGAWPVICVGAFVLPGVAAAALPPVRVWVAVPRVVSAALRVGHCVSLDGLALPMRLRRPFILRGRVYPTTSRGRQVAGAACP